MTAYKTKFQIDNLVRDCRNLQETVRHYNKQKKLLADALRVFTLTPGTVRWLEENDPMALRQANLALQAVADGASEIDLTDEAWPWCVHCQSYHAPNNPTCFRLTGQKAKVRRG